MHAIYGKVSIKLQSSLATNPQKFTWFNIDEKQISSLNFDFTVNLVLLLFFFWINNLVLYLNFNN